MYQCFKQILKPGQSGFQKIIASGHLIFIHKNDSRTIQTELKYHFKFNIKLNIEKYIYSCFYQATQN